MQLTLDVRVTLAEMLLERGVEYYRQSEDNHRTLRWLGYRGTLHVAGRGQVNVYLERNGRGDISLTVDPENDYFESVQQTSVDFYDSDERFYRHSADYVRPPGRIMAIEKQLREAMLKHESSLFGSRFMQEDWPELSAPTLRRSRRKTSRVSGGPKRRDQHIVGGVVDIVDTIHNDITDWDNVLSGVSEDDRAWEEYWQRVLA